VTNGLTQPPHSAASPEVGFCYSLLKSAGFVVGFSVHLFLSFWSVGSSHPKFSCFDLFFHVPPGVLPMGVVDDRPCWSMWACGSVPRERGTSQGALLGFPLLCFFVLFSGHQALMVSGASPVPLLRWGIHVVAPMFPDSVLVCFNGVFFQGEKGGKGAVGGWVAPLSWVMLKYIGVEVPPFLPYWLHHTLALFLAGVPPFFSCWSPLQHRDCCGTFLALLFPHLMLPYPIFYLPPSLLCLLVF